MLRLLGTAGILTGCALLSNRRVSREREHIRQLFAFAAALTAMERQLELCEPPMEALIAAAQEAAPELASLLGRISVEKLEYEPFSFQWNNMTGNNMLQITEEEKRPLRLLGTVLGRAAAREQCTVLTQTAEQLERFAQRRQEALEDRTRLWYTLALSAGALAVVMLL